MGDVTKHPDPVAAPPPPQVARISLRRHGPGLHPALAFKLAQHGADLRCACVVLGRGRAEKTGPGRGRLWEM